jgi:hypothetical protein
MRCSISGMAGPLLAGLAVALTTVACAGTGVPNPFTEVQASVAPEDERGSPDELRRPEILRRGSNDLTAMALIRRLRPAWLRARGQNSFSDRSAMYPVVYVDEIRHGSLDSLHRIPSSEVSSMRYFSPADATTRWGTGHPSGVINVVTGR